jgi:hypothetical protein
MRDLSPPRLIRQIGEWKWIHFEDIILNNWNKIPNDTKILVERSEIWIHYLKIKDGFLSRVSEPIDKSIQEIKQNFKNSLSIIQDENLRKQLQI